MCIRDRTYEDLDGIGKIASDIMDLNFKLKGRRGGRFRVTVSVSNFVPKEMCIRDRRRAGDDG